MLFFVLGASPSFVERSVDSLQSVTPRSLSKEGFLNQRVDEDTWLKCWVSPLLCNFSCIISVNGAPGNIRVVCFWDH